MKRTKTPKVPETALHTLIKESPELRESTRAQYLTDLDKFIGFVGAQPEGWTRQRTAEFYKHLTHGQGLKPQSANRIMASVQYASKWYASRHNDEKLEFAEIQLAPGKGKASREALTEGQVRALLDTCRNKTAYDLRDFAMIVLALDSGARRSSITGATWEGLRKGEHPSLAMPLKGMDEPYRVPLSDTALAAMGPWRSFLDKQRVAKEGAIFRGLIRTIKGIKVGNALTPAAFYEACQRRGDEANIGSLHPHAFRHTFITWRMAAGFTPFQVAAMTGHRLPGNWGGNLYGYTDKKVLAEQIRNTTPAWLADYVEQFAS